MFETLFTLWLQQSSTAMAVQIALIGAVTVMVVGMAATRQARKSRHLDHIERMAQKPLDHEENLEKIREQFQTAREKNAAEAKLISQDRKSGRDQ